jgi:outer membrane cobalamin receptor
MQKASALTPFLLVLCLTVASFNDISAQDTVRSLDEVEVSSQRAPATMRTAAPTQVMDIEKIEAQGALQLSDAIKQMAGVTLKDYGGIGGLKTVSARGLGTQF